MVADDRMVDREIQIATTEEQVGSAPEATKGPWKRGNSRGNAAVQRKQRLGKFGGRRRLFSFQIWGLDVG